MIENNFIKNKYDNIKNIFADKNVKKVIKNNIYEEVKNKNNIIKRFIENFKK